MMFLDIDDFDSTLFIYDYHKMASYVNTTTIGKGQKRYLPM